MVVPAEGTGRLIFVVMKKTIVCFLLALPLLWGEACSGDEGKVPPSPGKIIVSEGSEPGGYGSEGGTQRVRFTSDVDWTAAVSSPAKAGDDWCTVDPARGAAGPATVEIAVRPNDTYDDRSAEIVFRNPRGEAIHTIRIEQTQRNGLIIGQREFTLDCRGGRIEVTFLHNVDCRAEIAPQDDWIRPVGTKALRQDTLAFVVAPYAGTGVRRGRIVLRTGDGLLSDTVTVHQDAADPERAALKALYDSLGGDNWRERANWLSDEPLEAWAGIGTDAEGHVVSIELPDNGLEGVIPAAIGDLSSLEWLALTGNRIRGALPASIGRLSSLEALNLDNNRIGSLPAEVGSLPRLRTLTLSGNDLSGDLPAWVGDLPELEELDLDGNRLGGTIPDAFDRIEYLRIHPQQEGFGFDGYAGEREALLAFYRSTNEADAWRSNGNHNWASDEPLDRWAWIGLNERGHVRSLRSYFNACLNGTLPPEIGDLQSLDTLALYPENHGWGDLYLRGELPEELGRLKNLKVLDLRDARLEGDLFGIVRNFPKLVWLGISGTLFRGELTDEVLQSLPEGLTGLVIDDNENFVIRIPASIGRFGELRSLTLSPGNGSEVPEELFGLARLNLLSLRGFDIASVPTSIERLADLEFLGISGCSLSGPIPASLYRLRKLKYLLLNDNELSGEIAPEIGNLENLEGLDLSFNPLEGTVPEEFSRLVRLRALALSPTGMSGTIPQAVQRMPNYADVVRPALLSAGLRE